MFNGEIYNHRELRRELMARGHRFRTHSDTEAIVHAYEEYGDACVERLRRHVRVRDLRRDAAAMLFIARDRLGKKPFFYATLGGALHFAQRDQGAQRQPGVERRAGSRSALEGYLSLGYFLAPAHRLSPRAQAGARPLAAPERRPRVIDAQVLGHRGASTTIGAMPARAARRTR